MLRFLARGYLVALLYSAWVASASAIPTAPTGLAATNLKATSFTLTWAVATGGTGGIAGYTIYQDGVSIGTTTTARTFVVTSLAPVSTYSMTVTARDGTGAVSVPSVALAVTTLADTVVPSRPADLTATNITTSSCKLTWTGSTDNVGVAGYNVYRSGVLLGSTSSTAFDVSGLTPDTANNLTVRATDVAGNLSSASVALSVRTLALPPSVPIGLAGTALKATSFTLTWAASSGGTGGIAGYDVYQSGTLIGSTTTARSFAISGLAPTTTYSMTVVSRDTVGNASPASVALDVTTPVDTTVPIRPVDLAAASVTTTSFTLTWTGSTDNVGVVGYNIYRSGVLLGTTSATTYEVAGLLPDSTNNITVRAVDAAGNLSAASVALSVRMVALPPSTPTGLTVTALRPSSFTLQWIASTGGTGGIKGYEVYLNGVLIGSPTTRSLAVTGLAPQNAYSMTVTSHDSIGNVSAPSEALVVSTPADTTKPTVPKGLSADNVTPTSLTLTWTTSTDNVGVTGYDVYRNNLLIGSTPTPVFAVTGLAPATLSSMRVKAKDAAGNISGFSAILPVTTSAQPNVPPTVTLNSPADGSSFTLPFTLTLSATAADSDGTIAKVEFFDSGALLGETTAVSGQPGIWLLTLGAQLSAGIHSLSARTTDNKNATTDSAPVVITVNNPNQSPTVTLTAAASGTAPAFLTLATEATDSDGTITKVEFYEGGNLLGAVLAPTTPPSTFTFPLTLYSAGTYTITAVATDNSTAQSASVPVVINVNSGAAVLPFVANFESSEGFRLGSLSGQLSWFATGGVTVVPSVTPGSQQELSIPPAQPVEIFSHDFSATGVSPVFLDFYANPIAGNDPAAAVMFSTPAAQVALVGPSSPATLWLFGGGGQGWSSTNQAIPIDATGRTLDRLRLTTREDYLTKKWDLYLNSRMIAADVPFADPTATALTDFSVNGHATAASAFDSFYAGPENPLFADSNHNGLDDLWETSHGVSLSTDNRQLSPTGNGVTVLQAYLAGTDPNDFYNGAAPILSILSGDNQSAAPGQFNAQPLVVLVRNATGTPLANAPVTFTVTTSGGLLSIAATGPTPAATLSLLTAADGTAQAFYQQPATPGASGQITAAAGTSQITFSTTSSSPTDYYNGIAPIVEIVSGNNLYGYIGQINPQPFSVAVASADGTPLPNAPVTFTVASGGGLLATNAVAPELAASILVRTDDDGIAAAYYQQPSTPDTTSRIAVGAGTAHITFKTTGMSPPDIPSFSFDFETAEGFVVGTIDGQNGWQASWGLAQIVTGEMAPSGTQEVLIDADSALICDLPAPLTGVSHVGFSARPVAGSSGYSATKYIVGDAGVALVLTGTGNQAEIYRCNYNTYEGANSFAATGVNVPVDSDGRAGWLHFTLRLNCYLPAWDLYLGNVLITSNCYMESRFVREFRVINGASIPAYLDSVTNSAVLDSVAGGSFPDPNADTDRNSLADAWEMQHFGHKDVAPFADPDSDGITNQQEYQNGTDPNVFDNTAAESIQVLSQTTRYWAPTPGSVTYPRSYRGFLGIPYQNLPSSINYNLYAQLGNSSGRDNLMTVTITPVDPAHSLDKTYQATNDDTAGMYWTVLYLAIGALERTGPGLQLGLDHPYDGSISENELSFKYMALDGEHTLTATLSDPTQPVIGPETPGGSSVGEATLTMPTASISGGFVSTTSTYQLEIPAGWQGTVTWMIVFTPERAAGNKLYTQMSWTIDGSLSPRFTLNPNALHPGQNGTYEVFLYQAELAVDANRDGTIKLASEEDPAADPITTDATSREKPYRFWLNDDIDREHTVDGNDSEEDDIGPAEAAKSSNNWKPDCEDDAINGERDLEDLSRISISLKGLTAMINPPSRNWAATLFVGLKWTDIPNGTPKPAIRLFYDLNDDGTLGYLNDPTKSIRLQFAPKVVDTRHFDQSRPADPVSPEFSIIEGTETFIIPNDRFINLTEANPTIPFLFEACKPGKGQLKIVLLKKDGENYTEIGEGSGVWMDLKRIDDMYERWTVGDTNGGDPSATAVRQKATFGADGNLLSYSNGFAYAADAPEEMKYILYVHGWNMQPWEKNRFAETAFKRLWWQGYKGRFGVFCWPTTYSFVPPLSAILDSTNYDRGEWTAWRAATPLKDLLVNLHSPSAYGDQVYVMAHSMGNVVTGEALRLASQQGTGRLVNTYVASQAAVPAHCYDGARSEDIAAVFGFWQSIGRSFDGTIRLPNVYPDWLKGNGAAVGTRVNFYNENDYALWHDIWELNQYFKPDRDPHEYTYLDDLEQPPTTTGFGWIRTDGTADPSDRLLFRPASNTYLRVVALNLGTPADVGDRYEIMSFASESRTKALGATAGSLTLSDSVNLQSIWPADNQSVKLHDGLNYSAHKWHSAQFRSTNMRQHIYWETLLGRNGFRLITQP